MTMTKTVLQPPAYSYLRNQLMKMESFRQFPYKDIYGNVTIGYGRNLHAKGISKQGGAFLLDEDITEAEFFLKANIPYFEDLDDARKIVLINMCFNLGIDGLMKFKKMLTALGAGKYEEASREMLDSTWAKQVPSRAEILAKIMRTGFFV